MRHTRAVPAIVLLLAVAGNAQAQDADRPVENGGIHVDGWEGVVDARAAEAGQSAANASLTMHGDALHVRTGPAITYWNPANTASGEYTVSATFTEPAYMALNDHPHSYGIVVAGNDIGTDSQSYLYCAAYGTGSFIVRGFGPEPFQMNGRRGEVNDAVHKAAGPGEPVTQDIAVNVHEDRVECAINGTVVASYPRSEVVQQGRLRSTDGVYGIRFAHNTEATVSGLKVTQH